MKRAMSVFSPWEPCCLALVTMAFASNYYDSNGCLL